MAASNALVDMFGDISADEMSNHKDSIEQRSGGEEILPAGVYQMRVEDCEMRETQASGERYVWALLAVVDGKFEGVRKTIPFMVHAGDSERMTRARNELAVMMGACGVSPREGFNGLLDKHFRVEVDVYTKKKGNRAGEQANAFKWKTAERVAAAKQAAPPAEANASRARRWG